MTALPSDAPEVVHRNEEPTTASVVLSLARLETLRLARHPLFVACVILFFVVGISIGWTEYANADHTESETMLDYPVLPAFFLGMGGLVAMNRLAGGSQRAGEIARSAPVDPWARSVALSLACLLPGGIALIGTCIEYTRWVMDPPVNSVSWGEFSYPQLAAVMAQGVIAAVGGPLLGLAVARWWRWPTAGALTAVTLVLWSVLSISIVLDRSWWERLLHHSSPFTLVASNTETSSWTLGGNQYARVGYLVSLAALAALAACAWGSSGALRARQVRWAAALAVLALLLLVLATFTGMIGHYGPAPRY